MAFSPVVTGAGLAEDKVVGAEDLAVGAGSDGVHGAGFKIHEDGAWNVPSAAGFIIVDVDAFELELGVAAVLSGVVDAVLVADDLPELGSDLVTALPSLDVQDFSHFRPRVCKNVRDRKLGFEETWDWFRRKWK